MKVLIAGKNGQLGYELCRTVPREIKLIVYDRSELDITDSHKVFQIISSEKPNVVINAAAYTKVDQAETEKEVAFAVNAIGVENLAKAAHLHKSRFIHFSTDFVFDGKKSSPYLPTDTPHPLNVYGASKWEGEKRALAATNGKALIIRTSWVYSSHGSNFVKTMLRLMKERSEVGVVADQVGTPTWAQSLALNTWAALKKPSLCDVYHLTEAGVASWYDFAVAIFEEAINLRILKSFCRVNPIKTEDYPTLAKRPTYSVLDKSRNLKDLRFKFMHWNESLKSMLSELAQSKYSSSL
jgi:dTDP-4-dehydrorhamnose reductase